MTRVRPIDPELAEKNVQDIFKNIEKSMGSLFNIFRNMGNSTAVLKGYLALNDAVNQTTLNTKLREKIALAVAEANQCNYCLSAHTALAHNAGITDKEILNARGARADDPKTQAILDFVKTVVEKKAHVNDQDVDKLKAVGVNDQEIVEIILAIVLNTFTNYFNLITDPKIDFPLAPKI